MNYLKLVFFLFFMFTNIFVYSQDQSLPTENPTQGQDQDIAVQTTTEEVTPQETITKSGNITLNFKDADIRSVLRIISQKAAINIVPKPDVMGQVNVSLEDTPWENALDIILKTYNYGYVRQENVILVMKMEDVLKLQESEPLKTDVFHLNFLDAHDAAKVIKPQLSARGSVTVLDVRGQKGWKFGTFKIGKEEIATTAPERVAGPAGTLEQEDIKSKTLVVTDTPIILDKIRNVVLPTIDKKPRQVLIQARIMEVNRDTLKDIGFDWGTGSSGAEDHDSLQYTPLDKGRNQKDDMIGSGSFLGSEVTPSLFSPLTTTIDSTFPYNVGLQFILKKLTGAQLEVIIHVLEEDADTNTLSSPSILTLDNQEAGILVGLHRPIIKSELTAGSTTTGPMLTKTLDYYQEIGIRLNVVPQISQDERFINLMLHPSVTSSTSNITATSVIGTGATAITSSDTYPIINVREAQTQILIRNGETVVIGGLLKDVKSEQVLGTPILKDLPLIGNLFKRTTNDTEKIDLLIFITAHVLKEGEFTPDELKKLEYQRSHQVPPRLPVLTSNKIKRQKLKKK